MTAPDDLITALEAADLLRCHRRTVGGYVRSGKLRGWKRAGAAFLVSRAEVLALLEPYQPAPVVRLPKVPVTPEWAKEVLRQHGLPTESSPPRRQG